jgi:hypothetical protein
MRGIDHKPKFRCPLAKISSYDKEASKKPLLTLIASMIAEIVIRTRLAFIFSEKLDQCPSDRG